MENSIELDDMKGFLIANHKMKNRIDELEQQNQKLIEALEEIAGRKGPRNLTGDEMFHIAQQALDEVSNLDK